MAGPGSSNGALVSILEWAGGVAMKLPYCISDPRSLVRLWRSDRAGIGLGIECGIGAGDAWRGSATSESSDEGGFVKLGASRGANSVLLGRTEGVALLRVMARDMALTCFLPLL